MTLDPRTELAMIVSQILAISMVGSLEGPLMCVAMQPWCGVVWCGDLWSKSYSIYLDQKTISNRQVWMYCVRISELVAVEGIR